MRFGAVCFGLCILALTGCKREQKNLRPQPASVIVFSAAARQSAIQPAGKQTEPHTSNPSEGNAQDISEGQRLFSQYNCTGCHANGGGDKGPALMDGVWIYGSEPANIYATIVEGRPNGMPSFGGHIPDNEVWELVAYVRSLSGLVSSQAAPNRSDTMHVKKPESNVDEQKPVVAAPSGASERP